MNALIIPRKTGAGFEATLLDEPSWSYARFGGFDKASFHAALTMSEREWLGAADVVIEFGDGSAFYGVCWERPRPGEPVRVLGWGVAASFGRRESLFADTRLTEWRPRAWVGASKVMSPVMEAARLVVGYPSGTAIPSGSSHGWHREIPATTACKLSGPWVRTTTQTEFRIYRGVAGTGNVGEPIDWTLVNTFAPAGSGATSGTLDLAISNATPFTHLLWHVSVPTGYTPGADQNMAFVPKVHGVPGVTSPTTANILRNVLDNEIPVHYLPAGDEYRAHLDAETTVIEPCVFGDDADAIKKIAELLLYVAYDFGWYSKRIGGLRVPAPHYYARSTTPDYIIDVDDAISETLSDGDLEPMAGGVRAHYNDAQGYPRWVEAFDDDPDHYFVKLGMNTAATAKMADVRVPTTSSALATTAAQLAANEAGRFQMRGEWTGSKIRRAVGGELVPPSSVHRGMVRVLGLEKPVDALIETARGVGEGAATLALDNRPYAFSTTVALLNKRQS